MRCVIVFSLDWLFNNKYKVKVDNIYNKGVYPSVQYHVYDVSLPASPKEKLAITSYHYACEIARKIEFKGVPDSYKYTVVCIDAKKQVISVIVGYESDTDNERYYTAKKYTDAWQKRIAPLLAVIDKIAP